MRSSFDPRLLADFARYYGFHYGVCDPAALVKDLVLEMERGLRGDPSSLPMLPSYIVPGRGVPAGRTVLALDAGGTNLRAALVTFGPDGKATVDGLRKTHMPGTKGQVSSEQFFDELASHMEPLLSSGRAIDGIGFCFSYPMEITKEADGILLGFSKEVDCPSVVGKVIGKELRAALEKRGHKVPGRIVLLNDTVSALLAGLAEIPADGGLRKGEDVYGVEGGPAIGFILGTGLNLAYPESRIPKIAFDDPAAPQIVVCESGTFRNRYSGRLDEEFDATLKNPGAYGLEKTTAGAYLGPLSLFMLKKAVGDGVLAFRRSEELLAMPNLQTKDLNAFMHAPLAGEGPIGSLFAKDERDALSVLCFLVSIITERAALFAAAAVAGAVERTGAGYDPFVPVRVAVEGTTFMVYKGMRHALESYLHVLLCAKAPRSVVLHPVDQASLFGAAVAALS